MDYDTIVTKINEKLDYGHSGLDAVTLIHRATESGLEPTRLAELQTLIRTACRALGIPLVSVGEEAFDQPQLI